MRMFICLFIFLVFSSYTFSIEISSDLFIEGNDSESETMEMMEIMRDELQEPNIKKVYKKEKVIIKRDLSSLSHAVKGVSTEKLKANTSLDDENQSDQRGLDSELEEGSPHFVDYGDYEIHWSKE